MNNIVIEALKHISLRQSTFNMKPGSKWQATCACISSIHFTAKMWQPYSKIIFMHSKIGWLPIIVYGCHHATIAT